LLATINYLDKSKSKDNKHNFSVCFNYYRLFNCYYPKIL